MHSCGRRKGQIHRTRPSRSTSAENLKVYFHSGGATTMDLHRERSQRRRFVRHALTSPLEHVRQPDDTTLAYQKKSLQMSTSHFMTLWIQARCGITRVKTCWSNTSAKQDTFGANNDDVFVWERRSFSWPISAVDLSSVSITTQTAPPLLCEEA